MLCSTRISNELGAGNPKAAQGIVRVVVILGIVDGVIVSTFFVCCRHILGYAYSNDKEVVDYVSDIVPILCGSLLVKDFTRLKRNLKDRRSLGDWM